MKREFPPGTFLQTEKGYYYVFRLKGGAVVRYHITTKRVLDSWAPNRVIKAKENDYGVISLVVLGKMKFRDGSLLYSQATGRMYLVSEKKLRHITNPDWLEYLGFERSDAVWVSLDEINLHEKGEPLS